MQQPLPKERRKILSWGIQPMINHLRSKHYFSMPPPKSPNLNLTPYTQMNIMPKLIHLGCFKGCDCIRISSTLVVR